MISWKNVANNMAVQQEFGQLATVAVGQIADKLDANNPLFAEGGAGRDALHAAVAAISAAISGGNIAGAVGGSIAGDALQALARPIIEQAASAQDAARNALNNIVSTAGGALGGALAGGGSQGAIAGSGSAANNEVYNREFDPDGKPAKQKDLVAQVCPAGAQCSDATLTAAVQAQGDLAQAVSQTAIIAAISPNYGAVNVGSLSGNVSGYVNLYDGSLYLGGGVSAANPSSITYKPGVSGTIGYIFGAHDAKSTSDFLTGDGNQAFVSLP